MEPGFANLSDLSDSFATLNNEGAKPIKPSFIQDLVNQLEEPRISTCSFFPYTISHNSELAFMMRCKKTDSKQIGMYSDFGTTLRENEPNILFSAARSFIEKSAGILAKSE